MTTATVDDLKALRAKLKPRLTCYDLRKRSPIEAERCRSKKIFPNRMAAEYGAAASNHQMRTGIKLDTKGNPVSPYRCPVCAAWHLTAKRA